MVKFLSIACNGCHKLCSLLFAFVRFVSILSLFYLCRRGVGEGVSNGPIGLSVGGPAVDPGRLVDPEAGSGLDLLP